MVTLVANIVISILVINRVASLHAHETACTYSTTISLPLSALVHYYDCMVQLPASRV